MKVFKIIAFAVCFSMLFLPVFRSAGAAGFPPGDIDGDGDVTFDDAALIFNYVSGTGNLTVLQLERADINGDGRVTVVDAAQIFHFVSGVFSALPYSPKGKSRLYIASYPDKTEYIQGETLDMTGFSLFIEYADGEKVQIENYTYSGYSSEPGVKVIVVGFEGAKAAFLVTVYPRDISRIVLETLPDKLVYRPGEPLDLTGMTVTAVGAGGDCADVPEGKYAVSGYEAVLGTHTVTVTYRFKKASFTVTVLGD